MIVDIVNACLLNHFMNNRCGDFNVARGTNTCQNIHDYYGFVFATLIPVTAFFVPPLIVAAGYYARTTDLYRKQEATGLPTTAPTAVGGGRM